MRVVRRESGTFEVYRRHAGQTETPALWPVRAYYHGDESSRRAVTMTWRHVIAPSRHDDVAIRGSMFVRSCIFFIPHVKDVHAIHYDFICVDLASQLMTSHRNRPYRDLASQSANELASQSANDLASQSRMTSHRSQRMAQGAGVANVSHYFWSGLYETRTARPVVLDT